MIRTIARKWAMNLAVMVVFIWLPFALYTGAVYWLAPMFGTLPH